MTEIVYNTESLNKIVGIFAIECSIVFGFIILTIYCCTGNLFDSKKVDDRNHLIFKKYSSQFKLSDKLINHLISNEIKEKKNPEITKNKFSLKNLIFCFKKKKNEIDKEINLENKNIDIEMGLTEIESKTESKIECETNEQKEENILIEKDNILNQDNLDTKEVDNNISTEKLTNANINDNNKKIHKKMYIVYEFNNLDQISKPSKYMETEDSDEFDELEEFVNIILKSFKNKYEQVGIILKISSPGGSAFKFENAYLNLMRLRDKKIELIGIVDKMAASGGYMLAMSCDKIISSKYAIIGSVGVIAQLYNWSELNKKVGLEEKTFTTGSHKNPFPMGSPYIQEDIDRMNEMVGETFSVFKDIVFGGTRKFNQEQIEQITKAKTFHGFQAIQIGMVDQIQMSYEFLDELDNHGHNIWICKKEKESKSFLNSLLFGNVSYLIGGIKTIVENKMIENKFDKIKLI